MSISGVSTSTTNGIGNNYQMQGQRPPKPPSDDEMISKMTSDLGLSDDQVSKLKSLFSEDSDSDSDSSSSSVSSTDKDSMKAKMDAKMEKMKSILTPDQLTKFNNILDSHKQERQQQMSSAISQDGSVDTYA